MENLPIINPPDKLCINCAHFNPYVSDSGGMTDACVRKAHIKVSPVDGKKTVNGCLWAMSEREGAYYDGSFHSKCGHNAQHFKQKK